MPATTAAAPPATHPEAREAARARSLVYALDAAIAVERDRTAFLARIDAARTSLQRAYAAVYGDDYYAKLLFLKLSNFLVAKYQHAHRNVHAIARPVTLMVDPSNACQLACPGCVHSKNATFTRGLDWPAGTMRPATFADLLREHGPFALNAVLYNYGEPLLNKRVAEFVERAHGHGMSTHLSTNLSLRFDVERFVAAGPDRVILSIDGLTQQTYGRFRKGGDLALVLDNVRRMVEAKRKLGVSRPHLSWRFFPFEHNVHEVEDVIVRAREMGVDQVIIGTPFDVSNDDPGVRVVPCERRGRYDFHDPQALPAPPAQDLIERNDRVEALFDETWCERSRRVPDEPSRRDAPTCLWLYFNMTVDAIGRVMPCCISPSARKPLVYGDLADRSATPWDTEKFRRSRLAFADRARFHGSPRDPATGPEPWCASCPRQPRLTYGPANGARDLRTLDHRDALGAAQELWWQLGAWS